MLEHAHIAGRNFNQFVVLDIFDSDVQVKLERGYYLCVIVRASCTHICQSLGFAHIHGEIPRALGTEFGRVRR